MHLPADAVAGLGFTDRDTTVSTLEWRQEGEKASTGRGVRTPGRYSQEGLPLSTASHTEYGLLYFNWRQKNNLENRGETETTGEGVAHGQFASVTMNLSRYCVAGYDMAKVQAFLHSRTF